MRRLSNMIRPRGNLKRASVDAGIDDAELVSADRTLHPRCMYDPLPRIMR